MQNNKLDGLDEFLYLHWTTSGQEEYEEELDERAKAREREMEEADNAWSER